jgi:phospholipid-binding lipoprotein MlaA
MSGRNDRRLHRSGAPADACATPGGALAVCAVLAVVLSPLPAPAAADAGSEPSLASRLGAFAGSVYDNAESHLILPSRQAAEAALADPRTQEIYQTLSETAQRLVTLVDTRALQPISRESAEFIGRPEIRQAYEKVIATVGILAEQLRRHILDPVITGLKYAGGRAIEMLPARDAALPQLADAARPVPQAVALPDLRDGEISRYLNGNDPLEPFNRLMFRLNGGLQSGVFAPVSELYVDHTSTEVQLGIGNFFSNLREPATIVSAALEGQLDDAGTAAARFGINTTLGIAGFRDPATELGYMVRPRNLEETLCVYALPTGPYLVLPLFGPATLRDAAGRIGTNVMYYEVMGGSVYIPYRLSAFAVQYGNIKQRLDLIKKLSTDPYTSQKAFYLAMSELGCSEQAAARREFLTR